MCSKEADSTPIAGKGKRGPSIDKGGDRKSFDVEYTMNPAFPDLPSSVPLTYTLVMHACLSAAPAERPTFAQVRNTAPFHV